jgi:hypothetical protein
MFKQPKIEFFSMMPNLTKLAPIVPAGQFKPSWFAKAQDEFSDLTKDTSYGKNSITHTAKCPGIFNLIRYGYILTTWQDIVITTNGDKHTFEWRSPIDQSKYDSPAVSFMHKEQLSDYMGGWDDSLSCVIKFNTPWRVIVPKGYYLLEGPLPYTDEKRFTTMPGFFSREYGVAELNIQLKWHVLEGETLIKAGTPIAHYMLLPKDQPKLSVMDATPEQIEADQVSKLQNTRKFVRDYGSSKCIFGKLFK